MNRSRLIERVAESNRQAMDAWERWAPHRARVMSVFGHVPPQLTRWCILGAGHLHDVELSDLVAQGRHLSLVDVDAQTVADAMSRAGARVRDACLVMPSIDLTGVIELLEEPASDGSDAGRVMAALASHQTEVAGAPFDATVSLGVLTQLLQSITDAGFSPDEAARISLALRNKHLRDLVSLTRPGGTCVLVTDVVPSTMAPQLLHTAEADLESEMARLIAARNFFTGVNPYRIVALLEEDPAFRGLVRHVRLFDPWLWAVTPDRHHLTCAIVATRSAH